MNAAPALQLAGVDVEARAGLVEALRRESELRSIVAAQEARLTAQEARLADVERVLSAIKANLTGAAT